MIGGSILPILLILLILPRMRRMGRMQRMGSMRRMEPPGVLNYRGGNFNYHGGISSLPSQPPDNHPEGYPQRGGGRSRPPFDK